MNTITPNAQPEFVSFRKIPRLTREATITEKIDGSNAQILITESGDLFTGSRNRWITPSQDNFGFAAWCDANKSELLKLGPGRHFGEWWGSGIQRGYGQPPGVRHLSLFNTSLDPATLPSCVRLVPVLYRGLFSTEHADQALDDLIKRGSMAAPGFMNPEGIIVYHSAAGVYFKKTVHHGDPGTDGKE